MIFNYKKMDITQNKVATERVKGTYIANYKLVGAVVHKKLKKGLGHGLGHYTAFVRSRVNDNNALVWSG